MLDEHLEHVCDHPHSLTLLAWIGAEPAGLLMVDGHTDSPLFRYRHWAELVALYVVPSQRRTGLAARLVGAGSAWAQAQGYDRMQLYVTCSNTNARQFYAHQGFDSVQEIWRLELNPGRHLPQNDPDCEAIYADGHHLLSSLQHTVAGNNDDYQPGQQL